MDAFPPRTAIAALETLGVILVSGDDASSFLHAQLTGDINYLPINTSLLTAWCSAQGRVLALIRLARFNDGYALVLPKDLIEKSIKRLRLFVLRARVQIEDTGDRWQVLGLWGTEAENILRKHLTQVPSAGNETVETQNALVTRMPGSVARFLVIAATTDSSVKALEINALEASAEDWNRLDIESGLPQIYAATSEKFLPQMLELEKLGGLSYQKGCYPGQEVIARLHYRGELKRRLYRCRCDTEVVWPPGTGLYSSHEDESIGEVGEQWRIAPNPASDRITVIMPAGTVGPMDSQVIAADGRMVYAGSLHPDRTLDIHTLPVGLYSLLVTSDKTRQVLRFIKR